MSGANPNFTAQAFSGTPVPLTSVGTLVQVEFFSSAPTSTQNKFPLGTIGIVSSLGDVYQLTSKTASSAVWTVLAAGSSVLDTLTTDDSTVVPPTAGNIFVAGASGQLNTTGDASTSTVTVNLSNPSTAPGAFTVTGLLTGDAGITTSGGATNINSGTNATNISTDASATTVNIATGAAVKTTVLGSANSTSATTVQSGSGALNVTSTNGALTIDSGTGALGISTDAAATTLHIGTGAAAKTVVVGSTNTTSETTIQAGSGTLNITAANSEISILAGTGEILIGGDSTASTVSVGAGVGAKTCFFGSTNTTSSTTIQGGSGGIAITPTAGNVSMTPATSSGSSTTPTLNDRFATYTVTGLTTASGSSQAFTITNSNVLTTSAILCTVANLNASTNGAEMSLVGVVPATGSVVINTKNNGGGALGSGDNVIITLWVLS